MAEPRATPPAINLAHLPPITQATSAAIGSVISNAIVYPIDLVKYTHTLSTYQETPLTISTVPPLQLTTRIQTRRLKRRINKNQRPAFNRQSSLTSELSTTSAGSVPKDYSSLVKAIHTIIYLEEPSKSWIVKFYNGILIDSIATLINSFIYFYIYTNLNKLNIKYKKLSTNKKKVKFNWIQSSLEEILIGSLTGIISKAVTGPLNNITIRFQTRRSTNAKSSTSSFSKKLRFNADSNHYANERIQHQNESSTVHTKLLLVEPTLSSSSSSSDDESEIHHRSRKTGYVSSLISTIKSIYRDRGWAGFWSGFGKNCILSLNPSLSLYLTKVIKIITRKGVGSMGGARNNTNQKKQSNDIINNDLFITFINSALGSSLSTMITYPLMLSKTLIQSNVHPTRRQTNLTDRYRFYGSKSLYTGLSAKLIKVFLAHGITMTIKNWIESHFIALWIAFNYHHNHNLNHSN